MIHYRRVETKLVVSHLPDNKVPPRYQNLKTHLYLTEVELNEWIQEGPGLVFINGQPIWQAEQFNWHEIHSILIKPVPPETREEMRDPPADWLYPKFDVIVSGKPSGHETVKMSKADICQHLVHTDGWLFVDGQMVAVSTIADTDLSQATGIRITRPLVGGPGANSVHIYTPDFFTTEPLYGLFEFLEHYGMAPDDFTIIWCGKKTPFELLFEESDGTYKLRSNIRRISDEWEDFSMVFQHNNLKWSSKVDGACQNL